MGLKEIQIVFDNQWRTYYGGQQVTGRVLINLDAPKKIRGIVIKFKGEARVSFQKSETKRSGGKTRQVTRTFTASEIYFENKYNLIGSASGEMMMPAGEAWFPFQIALPHNLPSSFEGGHGYVRYTVKVTIDRPWKFDQEAKAAFTVISPLDLNLHIAAREPVKITQEKYFCCCCCRSGPLTLVVSLPHTGYVPGQRIPVTVEVDNISRQTISDVTCTLRKNVLYYASHPHHEKRHEMSHIATMSFGSVEKNGSATWAKLFDVPPLPPSNLANCTIIDLSYELKIEGKVSAMCHRNVDIKIPIVLGTIPLQEFAPPPIPGMQPAPGFQPNPGMPMATGYQNPSRIPTAPEFQPPSGQHPEGRAVPPPTDQPPAYPGYSHGGMDLYPSLPPPSFAEATGGGANILEEGDSQFMQGDSNFVPRYPVYNYNPSAPPAE